MAYLVGAQGKVIGVDFAASYIDFLRRQSDLHGLGIDARHSSFEDMRLEPGSLDGVFSRWALAWVPDPEAVLAKLKAALKPGGRMVIQEYFHWPLFQTEPQFPPLARAIAAAYRSMKEQPGDIDVGRHIPAMAARIGLHVLHTRPICKLAAPSELTWEWPSSFLRVYLPRVVERGLLDADDAHAALADLERLTGLPESRIICPVVMETVLGF